MYKAVPGMSFRWAQQRLEMTFSTSGQISNLSYTTKMSNKLAWIQAELDALKQNNLYNNVRTIESPQGAWIVVDGKRVLNFCSNN